jgi:hypothetical protein
MKWLRAIARSLVIVFGMGMMTLSPPSAHALTGGIEHDFLADSPAAVNYYRTCGHYWPSEGVFQTGVSSAGYETNWELVLKPTELESLHCLKRTFGTEFVELDMRLIGFTGQDDWDAYHITSTNLPGAVHDVAWEDTADRASPGVTNIRIDNLQANTRYHVGLAWQTSGLYPRVGWQQRVAFVWVPSHWRNAFTVGEAGCDIPYALSGWDSAWCIFPDVNSQTAAYVSGGYYDFSYDYPNDIGGDGIPFAGRQSFEYPLSITSSQPPPPAAVTGPPLFLVKTRNTDPARGWVEVHTALPSFGYGDGWHAGTRFGTGEQNNGWFQMVGNDLWYIKTKNTGSGRVELHSATAASGYRSGESIATYISTNDQDNGWFQMVGTELFFLKTKNTGIGKVEIHSATRASGYQSGQHNASWIPASDHSNGWFQMLGADLFFVKTKNTGSGQVEMHAAWASTSYQGADHSVTRFGTGEQDNGWFQIIHRDLWFIKTRNTGSGRVEIHSATEVSGYRAGQSNATWLSPLDQSNGWFQVGIK